jgi:hypothetical protein
MSELTIGPFFSRCSGEAICPDVEHGGCSLDFATPVYAASVPIYRAKMSDGEISFGTRFRNYFVHESKLPCDVSYLRCFGKQTAAGLFVPLEDALLSLYRSFSISRSLTRLLTEFGSVLNSSAETVRIADQASGEIEHLKPELSREGFRVTGFSCYGRTLTMSLSWRPKEDEQHATSQVELSLGYVDFRPLPNKTLGDGRWLKPRAEFLGILLRDELERICAGPPCNFLSPVGVEAAINEFRWHPLTLMTRQQARTARIQFVRENPDLWNKPRDLAKALLAAQLYAESTGIHKIIKNLPGLIGEAGGPCL